MLRDRLRIALLLKTLILTATAVPAYAHHEALFGPQSSAVLSPGSFLSAQIFDRQKGGDDERWRETTTVFSAGLQPFKRPLSFAVVVPVTFASGLNDSSHHGFEDAVVSARYRISADRLATSLGLDETYVMGVGGLELPTGTLDHPFGRGSAGEIAAGLVGIEKRPIALIGYAYYHHTNSYRGTRPSGNVFAGGGVAWTPIDDDAAGKMFSLQLGLSHERTFASEENAIPDVDSGSSGTFVHPGVVASATRHLQFFALVSLPVHQAWRSLEDRQRFRLALGTIFILGPR